MAWDSAGPQVDSRREGGSPGTSTSWMWEREWLQGSCQGKANGAARGALVAPASSAAQLQVHHEPVAPF